MREKLELNPSEIGQLRSLYHGHPGYIMEQLAHTLLSYGYIEETRLLDHYRITEAGRKFARLKSAAHYGHYVYRRES